MVTIKTNEEIDVMREGGRILIGILDKLCDMVAPGVGTGDLEKYACELMDEAGGRPAQKGFDMMDGRIFPTAIITCINEEVVHAAAVPSRKLKEGDILSIDFVMEYPLHNGKKDIPSHWPKNPHSELGGYYTDMSRTVGVGAISEEKKKLLDVTRKSLEFALAVIKPGGKLSDIGRAIQPYVEAEGYSVIRDLVGHGVGYSLHEDPAVPNYIIGEAQDMTFKPGMVFAVEPMIAIGEYSVKENKKNFAYYMADKKPSAHFEHTVAVTKTGNRILTLR